MPSRTGRPPKISKADVVAVARRILDDDGPAALTMRKVAAGLGTTAMALYHHVSDKDDLLRLVLDEYAAEIRLPTLRHEDPAQQVVAAATTLHAALLDRPWVVEVLRSDDLLSPRALRFTETIVDGLIRAGLTPDDAVDGYRIIWHYTAGEITARSAAAHRRRSAKPTHRSRVFADLDPAVLPRLAPLGPRWEDLTARDTFGKGVRALVHGLLAENLESGSPAARHGSAAGEGTPPGRPQR